MRMPSTSAGHKKNVAHSAAFVLKVKCLCFVESVALVNSLMSTRESACYSGLDGNGKESQSLLFTSASSL